MNIYTYFFWLRPVACGILVPQPGTEPMPPAVEAWSLNHWTAREVPHEYLLSINYMQYCGHRLIKRSPILEKIPA